MINITTDDSEIKTLIKDMTNADKATAFAAREIVRSVSFAVESKIKQEMPRRTGRASTSWGHGSEDSIWLSEDGGLAVTQGSNVDYIIFLELGHSRQAPAGFIERAGMRGQLELEYATGQLDPLSPEALQREYVVRFG